MASQIQIVTPERLAQSGSEDGHQAAVFCYFNLHKEKYPEAQLLFAIPNGGLRNLIVAARLKSTGVKAGVPDMFLPVARGDFYGLFIELKVKTIPTKEQRQWIYDLHQQGYMTIVCQGWEQVVQTIIEYLGKDER